MQVEADVRKCICVHTCQGYARVYTARTTALIIRLQGILQPLQTDDNQLSAFFVICTVNTRYLYRKLVSYAPLTCAKIKPTRYIRRTAPSKGPTRTRRISDKCCYFAASFRSASVPTRDHIKKGNQ